MATPASRVLRPRRIETQRPATDVPFVEWADLVQHIDWRQGEHVCAIGPTGCGKSTLLLEISRVRRYVAVVATKRKDDTLERVIRSGEYKRVTKWPPPFSGNQPVYPRVVFWPDIKRLDGERAQQEAVYRMLADVYDSGGWTINFDEVRYVSQHLGLARPVELLWQQGRSLGISVLCATQRPAFIPLAAYDQSSHLFLWRETDDRNVKRIAEIAGQSSREVRTYLPYLGTYECLYVNTRTGSFCRTMFRKPNGRTKA